MSGIVRNEVIVKFDLRKTQPRGDDLARTGQNEHSVQGHVRLLPITWFFDADRDERHLL